MAQLPSTATALHLVSCVTLSLYFLLLILLPTEFLKDNVSAHLIRRDTDRDYALFRLDYGEPSSEEFLGFDSIFPVDTVNPPNVGWHRLYSVGYNADHNRDDWYTWCGEYRRRLVPAVKGKLLANNPQVLVSVSYSIFT